MVLHETPRLYRGYPRRHRRRCAAVGVHLAAGRSADRGRRHREAPRRQPCHPTGSVSARPVPPPSRRRRPPVGRLRCSPAGRSGPPEHPGTIRTPRAARGAQGGTSPQTSQGSTSEPGLVDEPGRLPTGPAAGHGRSRRHSRRQHRAPDPLPRRKAGSAPSKGQLSGSAIADGGRTQARPSGWPRSAKTARRTSIRSLTRPSTRGRAGVPSRAGRPRSRHGRALPSRCTRRESLVENQHVPPRDPHRQRDLEDRRRRVEQPGPAPA